MNSNGPLIHVTKLKQDYTYYNSCERPKKNNEFMATSKALKLKHKLRPETAKKLLSLSDSNSSEEIYTERGRPKLEKHKDPKDRFSRKFFSEEKYHYSQNLQIEQELKNFKKEIEAKFKKSNVNKQYQYPRVKSGELTEKE